jgi:hypothetical protein
MQTNSFEVWFTIAKAAADGLIYLFAPLASAYKKPAVQAGFSCEAALKLSCRKPGTWRRPL